MPEIVIPNFEQVEIALPRLIAGAYTMNIQEIPTMDISKNGKQYVQIEMVVLDGPDQPDADPATGSFKPAGRKFRDRMYLVDGAYFRVKAFLIAAGLLKRDDKQSALALGKLNTDTWVGTRFSVVLQPKINPDNQKEYLECIYQT